MTIWSSEIRELEKLHHSIKETHPKLDKELSRLIRTDDENIALVYARRCLEIIISELCECELKRPRGSEPLKGIIDKLNREEKVPPHIIGSMNNINSISTFGAHPKEFDPRQVKPVLLDLTTTLRWYLKYDDTRTEDETGTPESDRGNAQVNLRQKSVSSRKRVLQISAIALAGAIVIVLLIVLNVFPWNKKPDTDEILEKSIAVLPFRNESSDAENTYFINGTMESILDNLCKIEDLRVVSRNSVEQYRNNPKPTPVVAQEMDVSYVLEGSGQKIGNRLLLTVQLIIATDDNHLWSKQYDREIRKVEDLIDLQAEIAKLVAGEIKAIITPEEKARIESIPTPSITAYDLYQRGMEELSDGNSDRAKYYFSEALATDSSFAGAYVGLGYVCWYKRDRTEYHSDNYADSLLLFSNTALAYNSQLPEAFTLRGLYYYVSGNYNLAVRDLNHAIRLKPNNGEAYRYLSLVYEYRDPVKALESLHKAISIDRGKSLAENLGQLAWHYFLAGYLDKSEQYNKEACKLQRDSTGYYLLQGHIHFYQGSYDASSDCYQKAIEYGLDFAGPWYGFSLLREGNYVEALDAFKAWVAYLEESGNLSHQHTHRLAYAFYINGFESEAEQYFDLGIDYFVKENSLDRPWAQGFFTYYDLAGIYAFRGQKEKAYENLRIFNQIEIVPYFMPFLIKTDVLFEHIRDEPEFQQIVRDIEAKYQAEHERVRQWLEENDML